MTGTGLCGHPVQGHAGGGRGGGVPGPQRVTGVVGGGQSSSMGAPGDDLGGRSGGDRLPGRRVLVVKRGEQWSERSPALVQPGLQGG